MQTAECAISAREARRAYRLAFAAFLIAAAALTIAVVSLFNGPWGGRVLQRVAGDPAENKVWVWKPGQSRGTPQRTIFGD